MSADTKLRDARPEDAGELLALIHTAFAEYRGQIDPPSGAHDDTLEKIQGNLERGHAVIAVQDDIAVGCVFYEITADHVYLYRLSVSPSVRRRGIGGRLVEHVEALARDRGLPVRLGVRVALPENRAYYERRGYRFIENCYHPGYREPTWVMLERRWD